MSVLTISRQFGAGGLTLGKMVSKELGYSFFDNEIIQMVAKKAKVSRHWAESMEKEAGGKFHRFISGLVPKNMIDRILGDERGYIDEEIYVDLLHDIIRKISEEGNAVILGRGGQYILEHFPDVFHILLVADKKHRVKFIEEKYDLFPRQAARSVDLDDRRRINLYRKFGREDYDQPIHYHMILNTKKLDLDKASEIICKLVRGS